MSTSPLILKGIEMGAVEDYINGLEGKDDLDIVKVAADLLRLHNDEMGPVVAKVEQLTDNLNTKDTELVNAQSEITRQKALNFDLATRVPVTNNQDANNSSEITGSTITPDDLFE